MNLGKLTPEQFLAFLEMARNVGHAHSEMIRDIRRDPEAMLANGYGPLPWAFLYEIPFAQMVGVWMMALARRRGYIDADSKELTADALLMLDASDVEKDLSVDEIKNARPLLVGISEASYRSVTSMAIWGRSLNSLIAGTRAGDDDLLIRAARIDPGVVTGPTGAARVNRAILFGERQFLKRLWGAMGKPPKKRSGVFNDIRLAMAVLRESRAELTDDELVWLFCDKLKLYSRRGDPAKSLRKLMGEVEPMSTTDKWPEWVVNLFKTGE